MQIPAYIYHEGTPGETLRGGLPVPPDPTGATITSFSLLSTSESAQTDVPVSVGQAFREGDFEATTQGLYARVDGVAIPCQIGAIATHADGSVRMGTVSCILPSMAAGATASVELFAGTLPAAAPAVDTAPDWNLKVEALVHYHQVTRVRFTDRVTGGYVLGQTVTLNIGAESFTVTIKSNQTGVTFTNAGNIAKEFLTLINTTSADYFAYRIGIGEGYERVWIRPKNLAAAGFTVTADYEGTAVITISDDFTYGGDPEIWSCSPQAELEAAIAARNAATPTVMSFIDGAVATEFRLLCPMVNEVTEAVHPHLTAVLDVRVYEDGSIWTDVAMEMCKMTVAAPRAITYALTIKHGATVSYTEPAFQHQYQARWHREVWNRPDPAYRITRDMQYIQDSRQIMNYDLSLELNPTLLSSATVPSLLAKLEAARTAREWMGPMAYLLVANSFGLAGGRYDIGVLPGPAVQHLVEQSDDTNELMMTFANEGAAVNVHWRDDATGLVMTVDDYPNINTGGNFSTPTIPPRGIDASRLDPVPWAPDCEHQPSFATLPYLLTGSHFWLEEIQYWASWSISRQPRDYRSFGAGLLNRQIPRAQAWTMRTLSDAARLTPDAHPKKTSFETFVDNNLNKYKDDYRVGTTNTAIHPMGSMATSNGRTALWQNDFFMCMLSILVENGYTKARDVMEFMAVFCVDRFNSPDFCLRQTMDYYWSTKETTGEWITTQAALYARNFPTSTVASCNTYALTGQDDNPWSYASIGLGALGAVASAGIAGAAEAYTAYKAIAPAVVSQWQKNPMWATIPRGA